MKWPFIFPLFFCLLFNSMTRIHSEPFSSQKNMRTKAQALLEHISAEDLIELIASLSQEELCCIEAEIKTYMHDDKTLLGNYTCSPFFSPLAKPLIGLYATGKWYGAGLLIGLMTSMAFFQIACCIFSLGCCIIEHTKKDE